LLVLTQKELEGAVKDMPTVKADKNVKYTRRTVLASDEVNYQGEAVAAVIASDPYAASDAADLVSVEYELLPAVMDPLKAIEDDSTKVHKELQDNLAYKYTIDSGSVDELFEKADQIVKARFLNQRIAPTPMETRGAVAQFDPGSKILRIYISTQDPFYLRDQLASILGLEKPQVEVFSPDVGGAFGSKISLYPEEVVVSYASMLLHRPVKWTESRRESLLTTTQGRGQIQFVEAAVKNNGKILALRVRIVADAGAYSTESAVYGPKVTVQISTGNYDIQGIKAELLCAFTNKVPHDAYRGAGRPEATYLIERTINTIALKLKLDPAKVRLVNYIPKDRFPFQIITRRFTYDSGDYERNLKKALEIFDYEGMRSYQARAREEGRLVGIGIASYVEVCGFGPDYPQTASITVTPDGKVLVNSGTNPHGQGHVTPFAQIVADELGVNLSDIHVRYGDTLSLPYGTVTAGSRSAAVGGSAVLISARKVKNKMSLIASKILNVAPEELVFNAGKIYSIHDESKSLSFSEVAEAAYDPGQLPKGMEPTLYEYTAFAPKSNTFPFGNHVVMVEIDKETGEIRILRYIAVDDCGRILNPLVAEGQVHGGVAQGLGQALVEGLFYDDSGQLLTATLADYAILNAEMMPRVQWYTTETPTDANPLGVKGIGEAPTIASTPAVVNAVEDALSQYGVTIDKMPLSPSYIWQLLHKN
ncbi:MAG: xanthine dehydrogenase family protein molybdopterin-binding subunit, partial [Conexivisphaerales archaeon]